MTWQNNIRKFLPLLLCAGLLLGACSPTASMEEVQPYFQPVDALTLPEGVTLVGIGEATHGNAEFVTLRREVLQELATRYGFRAFAIEGDFGGAQVVNRYVLEGVGTAEEAARAIGFAIYRTQEMVDLIEWIRQYNIAAVPEDQIRVYGYDMQRYDHNKAGLLEYIGQVDLAKQEEYRAGLADLNDETVFDQQPEKIRAGLEAIRQIRAEMLTEKERYVAASSQDAYALADQYALAIEQNATLRSGSVNYSQQRDQYMAEKVSWIVDYEQSQGRGKVLIAGHDGHIEKSAAAAAYRSMGSRLSEQYGEKYFAIGTEFIESSFLAKDEGSGERKLFSVRNNHALNRAFSVTGMDVAYLDIENALASESLSPLLTSAQPMSNIGDSFKGWYAYLPMLRTIKMVPVEAYDAIIFVREATPTTLLEG
jgi:erythromycin esterase